MSRDSSIFIEDIRKQLEKGRLVLVVGAGISLEAADNPNCASWKGLLEHGIGRCRALDHRLGERWGETQLSRIRNGDTSALIEVAQDISKRLGSPNGGEWARWLWETVGALKVRRKDTMAAISALGVPIATTNYDGLLEEALDRSPVIWQDQANVGRWVHGDEPGIFHLHGYWSKPESVILGIESYDKLLQEQFLQNVLRSLVLERILLFVGFGAGLSDPNFGSLRKWMAEVLKEHPYRHYRSVLDADVEVARAEYDGKDKIQVLPYGTKYGELSQFLHNLLPCGYFAKPPSEKSRPFGELAAYGYEIIKLIASGGTSRVWLAIRNGEQELAIKELQDFSPLGNEIASRWRIQFRNEWEILSQLRHPYIPRFYEFIEGAQTLYLVMEYVPGITLEETCRRQQPDERQVLAWGLELADLLRYLHGCNPPVIFRDLNPSNVVVRKTDNRLVLVDFGIAKSFRSEDYRYHTRTALRLGTEGYMAPEQNHTLLYEGPGEATTSERSDIYALGATLYYTLSRLVPRDAVRRALDLRRFGEEKLTPLRELVPSLSRNTEEVILKAMSLSQEERFPSVGEFEEALKTPDPLPEIMVHPRDGSSMVRVPKGPFVMGSNDGGEDERPLRSVELDAYCIDVNPVTYGQFKRFVDETNYRRPPYEGDSAYRTEEWFHYYGPGREDCPVVNVTWNDAQAYARWAGKELPTEEQWEKAARGKNGCIYPWGNQWDINRCNSFLLQRREVIAKMIDMWPGHRGTLPVGCFPEGVSPYGAMDMAGNVLEWTASDYTIPGAKAVRGGCWYRDSSYFFRCAKRYWYFSGYSVNWLGFRCICGPWA